MAEIDLRRNPWAQGFPREEQLVSRELYRLLTIFAASEELARRKTDDNGGCVYSWSIRSFEFPEVGRILLTIAALTRSDWDADPSRIDANLSTFGGDGVVGVLVPDLEAPSSSIPLTLRESLNKILHAYTINPDRSQGPSIVDGYLLPFIHLYGEKSGKRWKASVDVFKWAELLHALH